MALTAKKLWTAQIGIASTTLYPVPAVTKTRITEIILCNTTTGGVTVRLCFTVGATAMAVGNAIMWDFPLDPGVPFILPFNTWLNTPDTVKALCSVDLAITSHGSGIEET